MADISDGSPQARKRSAGKAMSRDDLGSARGGAAREQAAIAMIELLFFAYRDFTRDPDEILANFGFGRAHHRVLHFVNRNPGLRVADLLDILKIRKQSLARVLKQLVEDGFIERRAGADDQRERLLFTTERGRALALRLLRLQIERVENALGKPGAASYEPVVAFLMAMVGAGERDKVARLIAGSHNAAANHSEAPASQLKERP